MFLGVIFASLRSTGQPQLRVMLMQDGSPAMRRSCIISGNALRQRLNILYIQSKRIKVPRT